MQGELIERIYDAVTDPEGWPGVLAALCAGFSGHSGALAFTDTKTISQLALMHGVFEDDAMRRDYFSYYSTIDPAVPLFSGLAPGRHVRTFGYFTPREMERLEFYNDFYRKIGLADSVGVSLIGDSRSSAFVTVQKPHGAPVFSARETRSFVGVSRHLRRALLLRRELDLHDGAMRAMEEALDRLAVGAVVLDSRGSVHFWNASAQRIVEARDGLMQTTGGGIEPVDRAAAMRFAALRDPLLRGERDAGGGQCTAWRPDGRRPLSLLITPVPGGSGWSGLIGAAAALVLIRDPELVAESDIRRAMAPFGLTQAELAMVDDLVAGHSLNEHCERRHITMNTAKFHLRGVLAKTGARNQADLVRIALTNLRTL